MLTVVFGLFHGLVLLPVLLSLVGPKTEIESDIEDEVTSNFFFAFLPLANVASSVFVPLAIKVASYLFSIFFTTYQGGVHLGVGLFHRLRGLFSGGGNSRAGEPGLPGLKFKVLFCPHCHYKN